MSSQTDPVVVQNSIKSVAVISEFDDTVTVPLKGFPVTVELSESLVVGLTDVFGSPVNGLDVSNFNVFVLQDAKDTLSSIVDSTSTTFTNQWASLSFGGRLQLLFTLLTQGGRRLSVLTNPYANAPVEVLAVTRGELEVGL